VYFLAKPKRINMKILPIIITIFPSLVFGGWFGASNYDECILESMKGIESDTAAREIRYSCQSKFSSNTKKESYAKLTPDELSLLTGRAGYSGNGSFAGKLYNGNNEITVRNISFRVQTTIDGKVIVRTYTDSFLHGGLSPQSSSSFSFDIVAGDEGADYSWDTVSAEGRISK
jgi:hypothetical protein